MTSRKQLHEQLWSGAQQARANSSLKLNEISEPILGLIFLKFADIRFKRAQKEIETERAKQTSGRQRPISENDYKAHGVMFVPEEATYSYLMNLREGENMGKAVNTAMKLIEAANTDLAGVLPQSYTTFSKKTDENNQILISLLKTFNDIPDTIEGDALGEIYEYFLGQFALKEGQNGGEFFTAQSIVKLLVEVIEPYHGKIFDPACGSGGMFVQSANFIAKHTNKKDVMNEVTIYGQEKTSATVNIAKMNLAIHGLSGNIKESNSYYEDVHNSIGKFDFVLANPPFNVSGVDKNKNVVIDPARIKADKRYYLGLPVTQKGVVTNANYLWMQMFAAALNEKGRAGFVMANSASDAGNAEKEIRKKIIDSGIVDVVITTGTNLFLNVTLSSTLWFFDKAKVGSKRENSVLFINVSDISTPVPGERTKLYWTDDQINEIVSIVRSYREEDGYPAYEDILGRCRVVTRDEIAESDFSLNPKIYIQNPEKLFDNHSLENRLGSFHKIVSEYSKSSKESDKKIIETLNSLEYGINWDQCEFGSREILQNILNTIYIDWFINYRFPSHKSATFIDSKSKFGNIPESWEVKSVGQILARVKRKTKIKTTDYLEIGDYPVIDQGKSFIAGYTNDTSAVYKEPLIVFGDHTRCLKFCDFNFACGADGTQLLLSGDLERMPQKLFYIALQNVGLQNYEYARHFKFLKIMKLLIPDAETSAAFLKVAEPIFEKIKSLNELEIKSSQISY